MIKTVNLITEVPPDREIRISLPPDVPIGLAEIVIVIAPSASSTSHTQGDLLHSEFFGMWRDRTDISDSVKFARQLRKEAWSRSE